MVKVGLNIKNGSKAIKPSTGDVILFDGKDWYITTKEDLTREYEEHFDAKIAECDAKLIECERKIQELNAFKVEIAQQILDLNKIIKATVLKENN